MMTWTNGVERFPNAGEMADRLYSSIRANEKAYDAFGVWVNEEFTAWDAAVFSEIACKDGLNPMRGLFKLWMVDLATGHQEMLWELFGIKEVSR